MDAEICAADDEEERHLVAAWPMNGSCAGSACRGEEALNGLGAANRKRKKKKKRMSQRQSFFFFVGNQVSDDFLEAAAKPCFHIRPTRPRAHMDDLKQTTCAQNTRTRANKQMVHRVSSERNPGRKRKKKEEQSKEGTV